MLSTVLAPFLTPLLTYLYAGQKVNVDMFSMFLSIVKVVIVPIVLGFVINHFFKKFTEAAVEVLPLISTTAIVAIVTNHPKTVRSTPSARCRKAMRRVIIRVR